MLNIKYESHDPFSKVVADAHIRSKEIEVRYFSPSDSSEEFICVSYWDMDLKEKVNVFVASEALDVFIEKMSVICALRFKNKGDSCQ